MRLVFFASPAGAIPTLDALLADGHDIALVVTQPDRRRGRGGGATPTPVKAAALDRGLPVREPGRAREVVDEVGATGAELGVVVAFGQILAPALLDALPHGFVNLHYSLLPRWRGAAPVERAILAGDRETGVCVMRIDEGLDTGAVYGCERTAIGPHDTAGDLHDRLAGLGAALMSRTVPTVPGTEPTPQSGEATYAEKLTVEEFEIDWSQPATGIDRLVRAGNPRPGAWTTVDGTRVKVLRARVASDAPAAGTPAVATGEGTLVLDEVQPAGRPAMTAADWARGLHPEARGRFTLA